MPDYRITEYQFNLATARVNQIVSMQGEFLFIRNIGNLSADLQVSFDSGNTWIPCAQGDTYSFGKTAEGKPFIFDNIYVKNNASVGIAIFEFTTGIDLKRVPIIEPSTIKQGVSQSVVTVAVTATKIPAIPAVGRTSLLISNMSGVTVYIGDAAVTTANGFPIPNNGNLPLSILETVNIYGIVAVGTAAVNIIEGA
jgi:hypothetical protein